MGLLPKFFLSSIGRKVIMAVTGLGLVGFIVGHMLGNLQIFLGQDVYNSYAAFIKGMPEFLWASRIGLLGFVFLHIATGISLYRENKAARPEQYAYNNTVQASLSSRISLPTGIVILLFIIIHLAHFTVLAIYPEFANYHDANGRHDVYRMVIEGFSVAPYAWFYIAAMFCLGYHLNHGVSSVFQTLGLANDKLLANLKKASLGLSVIIVLGFISAPLAVQLGILSFNQ